MASSGPTPEELAALKKAMESMQEFQRQIAIVQAYVVEQLERLRYDPCQACGRRVPSPCNTAGGYHENGPWDFSCQEVLFGRD
jgi:hypothetical protein